MSAVRTGFAALTRAVGMSGVRRAATPPRAPRGLHRLVGLLAVLLFVSALPDGGSPAVAAAGEVVLASTSSSGATANGASFYVRVNREPLSSDGARVVFHSEATNLDPRDIDAVPDVYAKDRTSGMLQLISVRADGVKGNGASRHPAISGNGRKVAFETESTNLDPRDTDEHADLYVKDLVTGELALASTDRDGNKSYNGASGSSLSTDGTKLAFASSGGLAADHPTGNLAIYVKDLDSGRLQVASVGPDGRVAEVYGNGQLSGDGSRVVFGTPTTLLPADGDNNFDPADNKFDVYVKDLTTGEVLLADTTASGEKPDLGASAGSISANGTKVAFSTHSTNLDPRHPEQTSNVYVKDLVAGTLSLAGISESDVIVESGGAVLSADGTRVAFDAKTDPDGVTGDGDPDVYVKDLTTGVLLLASSTPSWDNTTGYMSLGGISGDGQRVAFTAGSPLTPEDTNETWDVYVKGLFDGATETKKTKKDKVKDKDKGNTTTSTTTTTVPAGSTITTYAGNGVAGYSGDGGSATSASISLDAGFTYCIREPCSPTDNILRDAGLALGADGSLYVADVENNRVRKVAPSGEITTVAGTGVREYSGDGGPATAAALADPRGLALDRAGNLYIADAGNHVVRRVDLGGAISTVAGSGTKGSGSHNYTDDGGPATEAALCYPQGVALDGAGALYIADTCNSSVRKVDGAGAITTVVGGPAATYGPEEGDGKPGLQVWLRGPGALAVDSIGNLYVGSNSTMWRLDTTGTLSLLADDVAAAGMALKGESDLYFSALSRGVVARLDLQTREITVVAGTVGGWGYSGDGGPATQAELRSPSGLALGAAGLFIADTENQRIRVVR